MKASPITPATAIPAICPVVRGSLCSGISADSLAALADSRAEPGVGAPEAELAVESVAVDRVVLVAVAAVKAFIDKEGNYTAS